LAQIRNIKDYYKKAEETAGGQPLQISFVPEEMGLVDDSDKLEQIILIRHGEPALKKDGGAKRPEAMDFIIAYDTVGIYPPEHYPVLLKSGEVKEIQTSSINRANHTARLIFGEGYIYKPDTLFREFERKILGFPNIKQPLKWWLVESRILWLLGANHKGIERFSEAKSRAARGVDKLEQIAAKDKKVILVAHGFLNRYLVKYLKKRGWEVAYDGGKDYLASWLLVRYSD
jgi:broad specificity phosphatase PhoE